MTRPSRTALLLIALAALAALCAPESGAQCALCRTALRGAGEATARAMNLGILVLLVPPVAIFCAIFAALRKSNRDDGGEDDAP